MGRSVIASVLAGSIVFASWAAAYAQPQILQTQPVSQAAVNPVHERAKTEAEQAYQKGDYAEAIELTSGVLQQNSSDHVAYYLRGSARVDLGKSRGDVRLIRSGITDAREAIRFARTPNFNYYLPYLYGMTSLAAIEKRDAHAEVAIKVAGQLIAQPKLKPDARANMYYQRALAQVHLKRFDAAVNDFSQAIVNEKLHFGAYVGLADAYAAAGNKTKALESYAAAINAFPSSPLVYNNRGNYFQQHGQSQEAIVDFTRAVELDPKFVVGYTNRGYALMEMGDLDVAENDFTESLKIDANQPMVLGLRATAKLLQGKTRPAIDDYSAAIQLNNRDASAHANLGFAQFFAKDYANALSSFNKAVSLDSQMRYLDPWRACSMQRLGQAAQAKTKFAASLNKQPQQRDWVDHLLIYVVGGSSEQQLMQLVSKDDNFKNAQICESHFFIGQHKAQAGDAEGAAEHFRQALATKVKHLSAYRGARYELKQF